MEIPNKTKGMTDIEYTTQTMLIGNATVIVRRPILTQEERTRREAEIKSMLINYNEKRDLYVNERKN